MKAIISTTYSDTYLFFLPIVTWCWNKLGVDVICFIPHTQQLDAKLNLATETIMKHCASKDNMACYFVAPEHKQATYAQVSRLFASSLDLPDEEILVTSDIDMAILNLGWFEKEGLVDDFNEDGFSIFGSDLVPARQFPMCYIAAKRRVWNQTFNPENKTYQQLLDELVGVIECTNFRGNQWSLDQDEAYRKIALKSQISYWNRAKPGTQFATRRYDRDDAFLLDRLSPDTVDYHMNRPGFEDKNFEIILQVLQYHYPNESFEWLVAYKEAYSSLVNQTT